MFDSSYPFRFVKNIKPKADDYFLMKRMYSFKGKDGVRYTIETEEYEHQLYAVKFFLTDHAHREDRFSVKTGRNDMAGIVGTCIEVMLAIKQEVPTASFVAVGAASEDEDERDAQRFRIYQLMFLNIFNPVNYAHYQNREKSTCFVIHRSLLKAGHFTAVRRVFRRYFELEVDGFEEE